MAIGDGSDSVDLAGKVALVTGAGRRVGAAIACALGEAGMRVAVHHHGSAAGAAEVCEQIAAAGGEGWAVAADLDDRKAARHLVDRTIEHFAGLDLLVLSAASFEATPLDTLDDAAWDRVLNLNLGAPFAMAQRATEALRAARGSLVFIGCTSRRAPFRDYLPYQVAKAGIHQMMRALSLQLAPEVRVNAVAPGSVLPPDEFDDSQLDALRRSIPLGRLGSAADVARAVLHLARSPFITGQELVVDGGRTLT